MHLADLPQPDTAATRAATEVIKRYAAPALANHAIRSYLLAAAYGQQLDIEFDAELLCVAAMLHDLGLEEPFDSHRLPFEEAGGHVAWVFAAGAGWPAERCGRVSEIVVRHMWDEVNPELDAEAHLLERATSLDISGRRGELWPYELRVEIVRAVPRLDLGDRFVRCFADQAARKPTSLAAAAVRAGIAERIASNPLDRLPPTG